MPDVTAVAFGPFPVEYRGEPAAWEWKRAHWPSMADRLEAAGMPVVREAHGFACVPAWVHEFVVSVYGRYELRFDDALAVALVAARHGHRACEGAYALGGVDAVVELSK